LMSMWGDFSVLRRIFDDELDNGGYSTSKYNNLSPADKTTLQTAACSLGMLANELYYLQTFEYDTSVNRLSMGPGSASASYLDILNARLVALKLDKNDFSDQSAYNDEVLSQLGLAALPDYWEEPPLGAGAVNRGYNGRANENTARGRNNYAYYADTNNFNDQYDFDGLEDEDKDAPPEAYIARLEQWRDADIIAIRRGGTTSLKYFAVDDDLINLAKIIMLREQTLRDRSHGFNLGNSPLCGSKSTLSFLLISDYSKAYGDPLPKNGTAAKILDDKTGLNVLCGKDSSNLNMAYPKFGVLHSIFPGDSTTPTPAGVGVIDSGDDHPETSKARPGETADRTIITNSLQPANYKYTAITTDDLKAIKLAPRKVDDWKLPHGDVETAVAETGSTYTKASPNSNSASYVVCSADFCGSTASGSQTVASSHRTRKMPVGFKDAAFYNSREFMSVRTMDMDLNILRSNSTGLGNSDRWLPNAGIVYAFREDAVREDSITRPARALWTDCNTDASYANGDGASCHMSSFDEDARDSKDPPLSETNSISPKPVDYAPDPDRRPNGFRLFNGEKLQRPNDEGRGISLVTDNAAYIKGDFNLHQDSNGNLLEEFTEHLYTSTGENFGIFYTRKNRDENFATIAGDEWRPSEILADAITIVSANFCDGSMFDSFHAAASSANGVQVKDEETINNRKIRAFDGSSVTRVNKPWRTLYGCNNTGATQPQTSYSNGLLPQVSLTSTAHKLGKSASYYTGLEEYWHHQNPYDTDSPYDLSRQANPLMPQTALPYDGNYLLINELDPSRQPGLARDTSVNSIIISGTSPTRPGQSYGGLHNFPRLLERWEGKNLRISGSLMQLNFSHTSTAPYDQDAWEPGALADSEHEYNLYYWAPQRLWGYDVGLQKGVAGPMAQRFTSGAEPTRSEFYSEPAADDPYIINLCKGYQRSIGGDPTSCDA
ncbi:MAG: hypothetical protein VKJ64_07410, partial [Leptolyngbyaceae bacterium]|nr:hypothetical protein [Leptolyngbyaceae bacterium]